jgi:crotonobetainyl-CoA:carnitine CoA-transferase CaiB-like acyl-CoA transferase
MLGMVQSDRYWPVACRALGIAHLEKEPRFADQTKRAVNCEELIAIMDERFATKSASEWITTFRATGDSIICNVQSICDLPSDPQVVANNYIVDLNHAVLGPVKVLGITTQLSKTPGRVKPEAPEFGQHTEQVLIDVGGYSWDEIVALKDAGII